MHGEHLHEQLASFRQERRRPQGAGAGWLKTDERKRLVPLNDRLTPRWYHPPGCSPRGTPMADLPIEVYGINLLVRIVPDEDAAIQLRCPKGTAMRYAEVVSRGDGFDSDGNVFRAMPH